MEAFWENKFQEIQTEWGFEPSETAIETCELFKNNNITDILIPGIGYGRNAKIFIDNGINITGIEISKSAIELAKKNGLNIPVHHGSVTQMPFDNKIFNGIFCYALIHLLNKKERRQFIRHCNQQLEENGLMIFVMISKKATICGSGKWISKDRYEIAKGLKVYFYDPETATNEFKNFGLLEVKEYDEPIKHMDNQPPLKCIMVTCKKG